MPKQSLLQIRSIGSSVHPTLTQSAGFGPTSIVTTWTGSVTVDNTLSSKNGVASRAQHPSSGPILVQDSQILDQSFAYLPCLAETVAAFFLVPCKLKQYSITDLAYRTS